MAEEEFGLQAYTAGLTFILFFGIAKAATNYVAGTWSDRWGRKPVLVAGWLVAFPVPLLLIWAPTWGWVVLANVLLGISQGLTWSTTVVMKIDLVGPTRRGLAMGLNEAAGYTAVAATALATGYLADSYGLRPAPFLLGLAFAVLGLGLSTVAVREPATTPGWRQPAMWDAPTAGITCTGTSPTGRSSPRRPSRARPVVGEPGGTRQQPQRRVGMRALPGSVRRGRVVPGQDRHPRCVVPGRLGRRAAAHGRPLGHVGRKWLIAGGMWLQALALALIALADAFAARAGAAVLLGAGTAMVYSTLLASIGDVAHPAWRA